MQRWQFPARYAAGSTLAIFADAQVYDFNGGTTIAGVTYNADALVHITGATVTVSEFNVRKLSPSGTGHGRQCRGNHHVGPVHLITTFRTFAGVDQSSPAGTVVTDTNRLLYR